MASFWSNTSPITKGAIVVGLLGFLYLGIAAVAGFAPFGGPESQMERGVPAP
jgi:hypothetical protein